MFSASFLSPERIGILSRVASPEEEERFKANYFRRLAESLLPYARKGLVRADQVSEWGKRGGAARRKYTEADKARWRLIAATLNSGVSKRAKAQFIAKKERLPSAAVDTIRREI